MNFPTDLKYTKDHDMKQIKSQIFEIVVVLLLSTMSISAVNKKTKGFVKFEGISAFDQRKVDYFYYEGLKLKAEGKYDAAYDAFNYCLEIDSTASAVLYELSSFYAQLNHPEKSVEMLKRAVTW